MRCLFLLPFIFILGFTYLNAQSAIAELQLTLEEIDKKDALPGFSAAIVSEEGPLFQATFGNADQEKQIPYTEDILQNVSSISKSLIGIGLFLAVEKGCLELDHPINDYLPFKIEHPFFPDIPITVRHLATHTSGVKDGKYYDFSYLPKEKIQLRVPGTRKITKTYNKNEVIPMQLLLKKTLHTSGEWYGKHNFYKSSPGQKYHYSNLGAALAALVLEGATGEKFRDYIQKNVFRPLKMENSVWNLSDLDPSKLATFYWGQSSIPPYEMITYPEQGLFTSIGDLSILLQELIKGYMGQGSLLSAASYQELFRSQLSRNQFAPDQYHSYNDSFETGIFIGITPNGNLGLIGKNPGIMAYMFFDPSTKIGKILMTNQSGSIEGRRTFRRIWEVLEQFTLKEVKKNQGLIKG